MPNSTRLPRSRTAARVLVFAAVLAAGLGVMSPAQAATTRDGCTVDPLTPYHNGTFTAGGQKWINYDVEITCSAGRSVQLVMDRMEADSGLNGADDFIGMSDTIKSFSTSRTIIWSITGVLPDNDGGLDQYSEMYHQVGFQVTTFAGVAGAWTNWEKSPVRSIHV
jgi:hypothetical protein